ncbi:NUDIX hydrolase [Amycolatopsis regifaucium]|uniref:DNA hydrolase n=1 Tax=Amycolatopsis regifaucium TaxID=546365 RepID=A0A154MV16_9PSEU|nr:NUDIX hydrolase [Amycolatopsis regifaucium]KZB88188.1 DNA hydrolase [Amycolatopsis regifaucium]OKA04311.1 DNA hydrolase [Amycolatopsis regifaucium]SFH46329.1 8-oxo-dGTP diphosphatase [Amycolatopsis regifaucium]
MIESTPVSVDVLVMRFDPGARTVLLGIAPRAAEPFEGELALPGVLLGLGERLRDAAGRAAVTKLGLPPDALSATGQLVTFDEPNRDPRGPTLSIALWATTDPALDVPGDVVWTPLDAVPPLAFDHDRIVADCRPLLADRLWRDVAFTAGLLGPAFTTAQALDATEALTGDRPYPANLGRIMERVPGLRRTTEHAAALPKGGRPPSLWRWE